MFYAHRITAILCFCLHISTTIHMCVNNKPENNFERIKTMNSFVSHDKFGTPVTLEWQQTTLFSLDFANAMKNVWPIAHLAYTPVEMQFLHAYPDVVKQDDHFKVFQPLFVNGPDAADWTLVEEKMREILKGHFVFDISSWPDSVIKKYANDILYYVSIKDSASQQIYGFITFLMRPDYPAGNIKVMSFAVDPAQQNRGLGKLLMSSIFKIYPEVKRIFLCTRVTNDHALRAYSNWGFTLDKNPILDHAFNLEHWTFMEYKKECCDILQK